MGADNFYVVRSGKSARDAFHAAVEEAAYEYGHGGYTGTIAEKYEFVTFPIPEGVEPREAANRATIGQADKDGWLIPDPDPTIQKIAEVAQDKWGPAACFDLGNGQYAFFGLASS
jgi:hypothetical protein